MISDEKIKDYSDVIDRNLGIDELLGLLAELIDDEKITKIVDEYIEDYNKWFVEASNALEMLDEINKVLKDYKG